jgi:transposase
MRYLSVRYSISLLIIFGFAKSLFRKLKSEFGSMFQKRGGEWKVKKKRRQRREGEGNTKTLSSKENCFTVLIASV